ncbi:MAG TPA: TraR/DksA family transcriptional regulator [Burkholderiales bacterium]
MKAWQHEELRRALELRRDALVGELERDAERVREERFTEVSQAELARDSDELRAIESACRRIVDGSYGVCVDCGAEIGFERLHAEPEAPRCVACQVRHERTYRS